MANQKQNPLGIFLLVAVIVIAIFFVVRTTRPKQSSQPMADWTCEECGYKFVAPMKSRPIDCPKDKGKAVRTLYYECGVHDQRFEAYSIKPSENSEQMVFKVPGGKWTTVFPGIVCPNGNDDPKTLKESPPKG